MVVGYVGFTLNAVKRVTGRNIWRIITKEHLASENGIEKHYEFRHWHAWTYNYAYEGITKGPYKLNFKEICCHIQKKVRIYVNLNRQERTVFSQISNF